MTERVFCKDCKHLHRITRYGWEEHSYQINGEHCLTQPNDDPDPITGEQRGYLDARVRNAGLNCPLFEPLPPPPTKPESWWRRWFRGANDPG